MSIHYLIDNATSPVADSKIRNVKFDTSTSPMSGGFVVRVEDHLDFNANQVSSFSQLMTSKYAAILQAYPGFSNIVYDDFMDATGVNTVAGVTNGCMLGERSTVRISGMLLTTVVNLVTTPAQAVVLWETYSIGGSNPKDGAMALTYQEALASALTVQVSFNNGGSYDNVTEGEVFPIGAGDQGDEMSLVFTNPGGPTVGLGSWAVIY